MKNQKSILVTLALVSIIGGIIFGYKHKEIRWVNNIERNLNKRISQWKECVNQYLVECSDNTISTIESCNLAEQNYLSCYTTESSCIQWEQSLQKSKSYHTLSNLIYECAQMCESYALQDTFFYQDIFLVKYQFCTE